MLQPTQVVQVVRKGFVSRQWNVSYFQLLPLQPRLKLLDLNLTLLLEHPRGEGGTHYNGLCGEAPPRKGYLLRIQAAGIVRGMKSVIAVCDRT